MIETQHTVQINWHDVTVAVNCNHAPIISHIREHVRPLVTTKLCDEPDVTIQINWREAEDGPAEYPLLALAENRRASKIGKRLYRIDDRLLWTDILRTKNTVTLLSLKKNRLCVEYDHYFEIPPKKLQRNPQYRYEKYFSLLKYFLYFPSIWYQEQFQKRYLLHASGASMNGNGVALGGVGGVGKTTTCIGLLTRENTHLLSENLIYFDEKNFYQLYEPIRLDDNSVKLLGEKKDSVFPCNFPDGTRPKQMFHVHDRYLKNQCPAKVMILPEFYQESSAKQISAQKAVMRLENYNLLTREVNDYFWYAATLNLLEGANNFPTYRRIETLQKLLADIPAYQLFIDRSQGVAPVVETISKLAEG